MMNLPNVVFHLSEMTQAQELLYKIFKEVINTTILEALKIPMFDEFRQIQAVDF